MNAKDVIKEIKAALKEYNIPDTAPVYVVSAFDSTSSIPTDVWVDYVCDKPRVFIGLKDD